MVPKQRAEATERSCHIERTRLGHGGVETHSPRRGAASNAFRQPRAPDPTAAPHATVHQEPPVGLCPIGRQPAGSGGGPTPAGRHSHPAGVLDHREGTP